MNRTAPVKNPVMTLINSLSLTPVNKPVTPVRFGLRTLRSPSLTRFAGGQNCSRDGNAVVSFVKSRFSNLIAQDMGARGVILKSTRHLLSVSSLP